MSHFREPSLPANFAAQLIELELELETNCCESTITPLINLYQDAIVYFEHFKTEDFHIYQARLQKLLKRKDVQSAMQHPYQSRASPTTIREKREFFQQQESQFSLTPKAIPKDTIRTHNLGSASAASKAVKDVIAQQSVLDVRLRMRKAKGIKWTALTPKVKRTAFVFDDVEDAVSVLDSLNTVPEENSSFMEQEIVTFGKRLEEVMEKHFSQKATKIAEIRLKYELQIQELEEEASPFINQVIEQMKSSMEKEIEKLTVDLDQQRKAAIEEVKAQFSVS